MDKKLQEIIEIKERQLAMQVLSRQLGIDISFSDEEVKKLIEEEYTNYLQENSKRRVKEWTKLAS